MANEVKLSVRADMQELIRQIEAVKSKMVEMGDEFKDVSTKSDKAFNESTKKVTTYFEKTRSIGKRVLDQLKSDFKSLLSINALQESLKLSNQFRGAIAQTIQLSDAIRKLGGRFGLTADQFVDFQKQITRGLGDLGLSSDVGAQAIQGLSESGVAVRGKGAVTEYARQAGGLAQLTGQPEQTGEVAKMLAQAMQAQGIDPNDIKAMQAMSDAVRKSFNATGATATQSLSRLQEIFARMPQDLRKSIGPKALGQLMTIGGAAGPGATKFLEEFLGSSKIQRQRFEAQGFKGVVGKEGVDLDKMQKAMAGVLSRVGGDPRLAAQTLGISEEAAEGLVRLSESMGRVREATDRFNGDMSDMKTQIEATRGIGESFNAAISKTKALFTGLTAPLTQGVNKALSKAAETEGGSAALVAGGATLAAVLAGGGLRGIGKGMLGGLGGSLVKGAAAEAITGKEVQPVYVVNASEIGGGGMAGAAAGMMGKFGGMARFGLYGLAAGGGIAAAHAVNAIPGVSEAGRGAAGSILGMFGMDPEEKAKKYAAEQQAYRAQKMGIPVDMLNAVSEGMVRGMEKVKFQVETKVPGTSVKSAPKRGGAQ